MPAGGPAPARLAAAAGTGAGAGWLKAAPEAEKREQGPALGSRTLFSGCSYSGHQRSDDRLYRVEVTFRTIDLEDGLVCGDLTIYDLTPAWPELTTFFDAEIIGKGGNTFVTNGWHSSSWVDKQHWERFEGFQSEFMHYPERYNPDTADVVFMRWKERFLVPDTSISTVDGASFAGFYYIRYQRSTGSITGFYYHRTSEWFQTLDLTLVPAQGVGSLTLL